MCLTWTEYKVNSSRGSSPSHWDHRSGQQTVRKWLPTQIVGLSCWFAMRALRIWNVHNWNCHSNYENSWNHVVAREAKDTERAIKEPSAPCECPTRGKRREQKNIFSFCRRVVIIFMQPLFLFSLTVLSALDLSLIAHDSCWEDMLKCRHK